MKFSKMPNYPERLKIGDTVGLICPSSPVSAKRAEQCRRAVERMGFRVKTADNLYENYGGFMAGSGEVRGRWINRMFADKEIKGIFCVRGGHGAAETVPYIDIDIVKDNPKIFVGYSDVTTLSLIFNQCCNLVTFHGPMVSSDMIDNWDRETEDAFLKAVMEDGPYQGGTKEYKQPAGLPIKVMRQGRAEGIITGGNLAILSAAMGTPYEMDAKDKIIFIEEDGETVSRIERYACQLKNAGKFQECRGVILGQFRDCENTEMPEYGWLECFKDILRDYDFPVIHNIQSGHGDPMITIPLGAMCEIDTQNTDINKINNIIKFRRTET